MIVQVLAMWVRLIGVNGIGLWRPAQGLRTRELVSAQEAPGFNDTERHVAVLRNDAMSLRSRRSSLIRPSHGLAALS